MAKIKMKEISKRELRKDLDVILTHVLFGHSYKVELGKDEYVYVIPDNEYRKLTNNENS